MTRSYIFASAFASVAAAVLIAPPVLAVEPAEGLVIGTTPVEIGAALSGDGYDLERISRDDGRIEVTAIRESRRIEMHLDPATGAVERLQTHERKGPWPLPGATNTEIMAALSAEGYQIMEYERDPGEIEVKALKDGKKWEIKIHPASGAIMKIEQEN